MKQRNDTDYQSYPGVLIFGGKTYWRKKIMSDISKKDALFFMDDGDVCVRAPVIKRKNRYDYVCYAFMWDYEVDICPDLQSEGSIIMDKKGKTLEDIKEFYIPTDYSYSRAYGGLKQWWK